MNTKEQSTNHREMGDGFTSLMERMDEIHEIQTLQLARLEELILIAIILSILDLPGLREYILKFISQFF